MVTDNKGTMAATPSHEVDKNLQDMGNKKVNVRDVTSYMYIVYSNYYLRNIIHVIK